MTARNRVLLVATVLVVLFGTAYLQRPGQTGLPLDPRGTGPLGTKASVMLLERFGADVTIDPALPEGTPDAVLVLADVLAPADWDALQRFAADGGLLVVADPEAPGAPSASSAPEVVGRRDSLARRCDLAGLEALTSVDIETSLRFDPGKGVGCFGSPQAGFHLVAEGPPSNQRIYLSSSEVFTNAALARPDNAALVATLLAPRVGFQVHVVDPVAPPPSGGSGLLDLLGPNVKLALWQLAIGFLAVVGWRIRRLGLPVTENQPVELQSSEMVSAVSRLLRKGRHRETAADLMRRDLRRELAATTGADPAATTGQIAASVAAKGLEAQRVVEVLAGPVPVNDSALVRLGQEIDALREELTNASQA